jgi:dTDP-glucose 4,6-dehydratase
MNILVTGGSGFIGSSLVRYLVLDRKVSVLNIDKLTYASNQKSLSCLENNPLYRFEKLDICDSKKIAATLEKFQPTHILHLAAESHVDRSIENAENFIQSNIVGTYVLLNNAFKYWESKNRPNDFRFVHVSTDEVYGTLGFDDPPFTEKSPYLPNSPYSASKAASDHLARAWFHTHRLPVLTTHCSNNYGPYQFPEKLIPLMIQQCLNNLPLPVYGNGSNIRDWIYVDDHARGIFQVALQGVPGETYNMGGEAEISNIELVKKICNILDRLSPRQDRKSYQTQISYVKDRPGHDLRYAINNEKTIREIAWKPSVTLEEGLMKTVTWYLENRT